MKLEEILSLQPQCSAIEYGKEPSLYELIEKYYEPYFPTKYKDVAKDYVEELKKLVVNDTKSFLVGSTVKVVFDENEDNPNSFNNEGVYIGDYGVITNMGERGEFPIDVYIPSIGSTIGFTQNELEVVNHAEV